MTTKKSSCLDDFNYETYSLIWLDSHANNSPEIEEKLRNIINYTKLFQTIDQCEQYIQTISQYDRIILIIPSEFAHEILLCIHSIRQISSIYIYGTDINLNKQYPKIKCTTLNMDDLILKLQSDQDKQIPSKLDEYFPISIFKSNSSQMVSSFFTSHLIMTCLLHEEMNLLDHRPFISLCRDIYKNNVNRMNQINYFEQTYSSNQALLWYLKDRCFSKMLNKILCFQNINKLLLIRFFLYDLRQELKEKQYLSSISLYRTYILSNEELQILKDSIDEFISINTFLTTKINRQQALVEVDNLHLSNDLHRVLFEIEVHSPINDAYPFSMINSSEVLFMCGSIFRLVDVYHHNDELWIIRMNFSSLNDENLISKFDCFKRQFAYNNKEVNLLTLGNLLSKMNQLTEAENYYLYMIDIVSQKNQLISADFYYNLGHIYSEKNDYDLSLKYYHQSLEIWKKILKSNNPDLADNYNAIATNYWKKGDYHQALNSFHKALEIFQNAYGYDHMDVATCLNNMGTVISQEKDYSQALNYYLKALSLFQKYLPINHLNLASLHCNISSMYKNLNKIDLTLEHLHSALNIYEKSFKFDHPNILMMLKNIAFLYEQKEDYDKALIYYKKISNIYQRTISLTDPILVQNDEKIQYLLSLQNT
ncbi:hypothetical protein I4U23_020247 [Adineta vaga]|nr:hypothetical protein I4U23_020247 [Adineta vaga]